MRRIPLTRGKVALVDDEWFDYLNQWKWCILGGDCGRFYAYRATSRKGGKQERVIMHRVIMGNKRGFQVDHIDGDGLNNQTSNLRVVTQSQNQMNRGKTKLNTSGFKGVSWHKNNLKWRVQIQTDGCKRTLGYYSDVVQAALVYDEAAKKYHGSYARLNFDPLDKRLN